MGQACCSYAPKDANNENFGNGKNIDKRNSKLYIIDAEKGAKALAHAKNHLAAVVKLQSFARGCLARRRIGIGGKKKSGRKGRKSDRGMSDLE
jgi:hypothetical protein